jgi:voltage-dependent calcium channel R type alpha-1E
MLAVKTNVKKKAKWRTDNERTAVHYKLIDH